MSSTPSKSTQTRKINRLNELARISRESQEKQKFPLITPKKLFSNQKIRLFSKNYKNNYIGRQLANKNPSEYIRQKMKLTVKQKINENAAKQRAAMTTVTMNQNRGRTIRRGPGSRGSSVNPTANAITRRIREARDKRAKERMNAMLSGNFRE